MSATGNDSSNPQQTVQPIFFVKAKQTGDYGCQYSANGHDGTRSAHIEAESHGRSAFTYIGNVQDNAHGAATLYSQHQKRREDVPRAQNLQSQQPETSYPSPGQGSTQQQWPPYHQTWVYGPDWMSQQTTSQQQPGSQQYRPARRLLEVGSEHEGVSRNLERNARERVLHANSRSRSS